MAVGDRVITPSQDGLTTHWDPLQTAVCTRRLHHGTFRSVVWVYLRCSAEISDALRCVGGDASEYVHHGTHPSSLRITDDSGNPIRQRGRGPNVVPGLWSPKGIAVLLDAP